jgi:large subunit ribosomal protein L35
VDGKDAVDEYKSETIEEKAMPKQKTKKGVKKRFRLTKTGKVKRSKAGGRHILSKKSRKRKRALRKSGLVDSTMEKKVRRLLHG